MLLVVNYHYVARAGATTAARAIYPVTVDVLERQLDELARAFEFVSRDDVLAAVDGVGELPPRACLVTFDDGLAEQVELALPALRRRGIPALFFVCGAPLAERRVLFAHKVHLLREAMTDAELRDALGPAGATGVDDGVAREHYRYDDLPAARLKYLLNHVLGPQRPGPVDAVFADRFDEADLAGRLYASPEQVRELHALGMLGAHGYAHLPLGALAEADARADVDRGAAALADVVGAPPRAFSYPYGTPAAVTRESARAVGACGFAAAFTLERAFNATLDEPLLLARVDTNDVPGGSRPLFATEEGALVVRPGLSPGRTRYLQEAA
jgi:peptidoglycan/xylan/chitin deacetylase (PgdA/CDA1 family)